MIKTVSIPNYNPDPKNPDPVMKDVEMEVSGDWGYRLVTDEEAESDLYAWVKKGSGWYSKRWGPYYTVTHVPSGLLAASNLTKKNMQGIMKGLKSIKATWDGAGDCPDVFLKEVLDIITPFDWKKRYWRE